MLIFADTAENQPARLELPPRAYPRRLANQASPAARLLPPPVAVPCSSAIAGRRPDGHRSSPNSSPFSRGRPHPLRQILRPSFHRLDALFNSLPATASIVPTYRGNRRSERHRCNQKTERSRNESGSRSGGWGKGTPGEVSRRRKDSSILVPTCQNDVEYLFQNRNENQNGRGERRGKIASGR